MDHLATFRATRQIATLVATETVSTQLTNFFLELLKFYKCGLAMVFIRGLVVIFRCVCVCVVRREIIFLELFFISICGSNTGYGEPDNVHTVFFL